MKSIQTFIATIILMLLLMGANVFAECVQNNDEVKITGEFDSICLVTVDIYKPGRNPEDVTEDDAISDFIIYRDQFYTKNDGTFALTLNFDDAESGKYSVYVKAKTGESIESEFRYVNSEENKVALNTIAEFMRNSEPADEQERMIAFHNIIEENRDALGFADITEFELDHEKVSKILYYAYRADAVYNLSTEENIELYKKCEIYEAINEKLIDNIFDYSKELGLYDCDIADCLFENEELKNYMSEKICKNITTCIADAQEYQLKNLEELMIEPLILSVVKNPNGYENITFLFNELKQEIGLDDYKITDSTARKIVGEYADLDEFKEKVIALLKKDDSDKGGSSSGGSSGGSSGKKSSQNVVLPSSSAQKTENTTIPEQIYKDVPKGFWAEEAIVNLTEEGILSGRGDENFYPDDTVTREEFVKMIVATFAQKEEEAELKFEDVKSDAWYYQYVAKAYGVNIISGMSDTKFGIGENITRQDMAVIIRNTAEYAKIQLSEDADYTLFSDDAQISEYAKNAVYVLRNSGIINGVDSSNFAPRGFATRAQAAFIIYTLLNA